MNEIQFLLCIFIGPFLVQFLFGIIVRHKVIRYLPLVGFIGIYVVSILEQRNIVYLDQYFTNLYPYFRIDALDLYYYFGIAILFSALIGSLAVSATVDKPK